MRTFLLLLDLLDVDRALLPELGVLVAEHLDGLRHGPQLLHQLLVQAGPGRAQAQAIDGPRRAVGRAGTSKVGRVVIRRADGASQLENIKV